MDPYLGGPITGSAYNWAFAVSICYLGDYFDDGNKMNELTNEDHRQGDATNIRI